MEPTKPKIPAEAVELYNLFIHSVISRRAFLDGVQKFAIGGLAASTILEALMPNYAYGQQVVDTNLTGVFLCAQHAVRMMKAQDPRGGRIINNGSISAHTPRPNSCLLYTSPSPRD